MDKQEENRPKEEEAPEMQEAKRDSPKLDKNHHNSAQTKPHIITSTDTTSHVRKKTQEPSGDMTISTKMSTDQLICKTPQESPNGSVTDLKAQKERASKHDQMVLYLGTLQFVLGFFMVVFGIFTIVHKASLSQLGGGIWAGLLSMATGISGMLAAARNFCPFKSTVQRVAHTVFLALSLISLAVAQLIVVIAGTGLARDLNSAAEYGRENFEDSPSIIRTIPVPLLENYRLLFSIALIVAASLECIFAAISAYKSSRELCSCFKGEEDFYQENLNINRSHAIVSSWLGKHSDLSGSPQPIYVVASGPPSSLRRRSMISNGMPIPIYAFPAQPMVQAQMMGYPLIPAPLGPVPSPIIPPTSRRHMMKIHKKYKSKSKSRSKEPAFRKSKSKSRSKSKSKSREPRQMTEAEAVKTYTGLDRAIAEEFIDKCEMKNASSLCSESSSSCQSNSYQSSNICQSPCDCPGGCNNCTNSDADSKDCLVNRKK